MFAKVLVSFVCIVVVVSVLASCYFYKYAFIPGKKKFIHKNTLGSEVTETPEKHWFNTFENRQDWNITSYDGLTLRAVHFPSNSKKNKTVIVAHGYMGSAETMAVFAKMFHNWGYNVLVPDARGHGKSEGKYIGFGWPDRKDYVDWINKVIQEGNPDTQIVLYGISMGGATVMMTSGEKLPNNVKVIIEDCGYSSVKEELKYQLKEMYHLPAFPLLPLTSCIAKLRIGFFFGEASSMKQLTKNTLPILFIHGRVDKFVPFDMLNEVYWSTKGPKKKYTVERAAHAQSYSMNPCEYQKLVKLYLDKYMN